jgi:hypothetical protein
MNAVVHLHVPTSFVPIDLNATPDERTRAVPGLDAFIAQLRAGRTSYAALFLAPPDRSGYFAISEPAGAPPDLDLLAARLAGSVEVRRVDLPCGPAVTLTEQTSTDDTGAPRPAVHEHALVLHPTGNQIVAFTLATSDATRQPEHAHLFAEILSTVTFPSSR